MKRISIIVGCALVLFLLSACHAPDARELLLEYHYADADVAQAEPEVIYGNIAYHVCSREEAFAFRKNIPEDMTVVKENADTVYNDSEKLCQIVDEPAGDGLTYYMLRAESMPEYLVLIPHSEKEKPFSYFFSFHWLVDERGTPFGYFLKQADK